ncbi:MAG: hypothetical protein ACPLXP_01550, partial [Microgenomates group bacterium]
EGHLWRKLLGSIFDDHTLLERFPFLSGQTAKRIERKKLFGGKTQVLAGFPKSVAPILKKIKRMNDPYVVYIGSSVLDIENFKKIIEGLQRQELPFDRVVFCSTNHLIL